MPKYSYYSYKCRLKIELCCMLLKMKVRKEEVFCFFFNSPDQRPCEVFWENFEYSIEQAINYKLYIKHNHKW
jgi:hypothetical protein